MKPTLDLQAIDKSWTLFLDRDGVLNKEKKDDYIYNPGEFVFYPGVLDAMVSLSQKFNRIILVTNQRGVEKELMTLQDLEDVFDYMNNALRSVGAKIDRIYFCTSLDNDDPNRKPQPGMAFQAKADFPEIDFSKSIMVGNNISDMEFGRNAGMFTVFLKTTSPDQGSHPAIDQAFNNLLNFSAAISAA